MFILDERIVISASDVTGAAACEFAFLRKLDERLGRDVLVPKDDDPMRKRAAVLGDTHEARQLASYQAIHGADRVTQIASVRAYTAQALTEAAQLTRDALESDTKVIFQATFFDPELRVGAGTKRTIAFVGFADFLVNVAEAGEHLWQVQDTKLARRARVPALVQLAAYADQLRRLNVPVDPEGVLLLGDGSASPHQLSDVMALYLSRRQRVIDLIDDSTARPDDQVTPWPRSVSESTIVACGKCEVCEPEVERHRDPLLIANIRVNQRNRLMLAGFATIESVANALPEIATGAIQVPGISQHVLERIAWQASLQIEAERSGTIPLRVIDPRALAVLPLPNPGDLFFDFEGDPMHLEFTADGTPRWGLDYLFGMVDEEEHFTAFWAHSQEEEKQALIDFITFVSERRKQFPGMRIYHYAPYEHTHLLSIAARHGVCENEVDNLLRENVLVDLYPVVRRALRVGTRSYSIKKLEPLYMGDEYRDEEGITTGGESVVEYAAARLLLRSTEARERAEGEQRLRAIEDYNRYDCVSTHRLRNWLLSQSEGFLVDHTVSEPLHEEPVNGQLIEQVEALEIGEVAARLLEHARTADNDRDRTAAALAASAIDYYTREHKSYWWEHFARLANPIEDWADQRDVMVVDATISQNDEPWHLPPRARNYRRVITLRGEIAPGTTFSEGSEVFAVYEHPAPFVDPGTHPGQRPARRVKIIEVHDDGVTIVEMLPKDSAEFEVLPIALTPGPPPAVKSQVEAILEWGAQYADALDRGETFNNPVIGVFRREPVRSMSGDEPGDIIDDVTTELQRLKQQALAVQGPPGTGKTYLAAHVMKRLVEQHGWKIGVVAQSHKVVENVLKATVEAGLNPEQIAKAPRTGESGEDAPYTVLSRGEHLRFQAEQTRQGRGFVIGGTAWDFSNTARFERGGLDLLVIDEAGQFSLAPTIASAVAAERLLLLGDPQQLPQVTQGQHPEPIDTSALGWLIGDHDTLPEDLGFFLAETRRMQPALAEIVSALSYRGRLRAHPHASTRTVTGAGPAGLVWHPVAHHNNATFSTEEAAEVVRIVQSSLAGTLHTADEGERALTEEDLIVVAAYNAQVTRVSEALATAGFSGVRVGTVDKFQGQEAVIAIVTLAASSPDDIPRGLEFLLMRNRLNVAISRAQWAAHLVSSPFLGGSGLPSSIEASNALSGYLMLTQATPPTQ